MALALLLRFGIRSVVCAVAVILQLATCAPSTLAGDELQKLVLPIESSEDNVVAAREALLSILYPIVPTKTSKVTITQDGRYILSGELFGSGTLYALATLNTRQPAEGEDASVGVGFAVWTGKQWEVRGLWQIDPVWDQGDKEEDHYPIQPSKAPFWLQDLGGDRTPEVVFVGGAGRYYQEHFVLKLTDRGTLHLVAEAMGKPAVAAGMLRLHFNSGRRAEFSREEFFRWAGDTLVPVATFHEETPYDDPESPFIRITKYDEKGKGGKRWRISFDDSDTSTWQYLILCESPDADPVGFPPVKDEVKPTPSAKVSFIWPEEDPSKHPPTDTITVEYRYFWERLSGLPWSVLPSEPDEPSPPRLPNGVRVKVSGDPELVRRLSTEFIERIAPPSTRPGRRGNP